MRRSERLIATAEMLRRQGSRGCSAERLASEFGVSARTVKRDLAALANSGAPVWSRPGPGGGYGLAGSGSLPPVSLTPAQAVALLAAVSAAAQAPYADLAWAGVNKIVDVLDPATRARALDLAGRVWVNVPATDRTVMSAVEEAMTDQRVVRLRYEARDGTRTSRDVEPVIFACARGPGTSWGGAGCGRACAGSPWSGSGAPRSR
ncbi:helix-turn-helix transcriptional regulator [Propioniciclava coleopterorum]|uniref:helix-turn-helix transcriptional regulator n=1 Tax=Propioniciclava coleopterorum TaxID=2714937 RepID=UPI00197E7B94|nr:HTH domain-containing protein [Propioniciclava coleopterorum]